MSKLHFSVKKILSIFSVLSIFLLSSCTETPEKFFDITVLNTNVINDFASPDLARHIDDEAKEYPNIPSSKKKGDEAVTTVKNKILYLEQALEKVKKISASGDEEKEIKALSTALYEMAIPVYKNEYLAYANLCDQKGSQEAKDAIIKDIDQKYAATFEQQYTELMEKGKAYAAANNIPVNWGR
ncbi:hypothetical protein [Pedobacter rhizosphaerae]|uniref:Lipoprotein n=1 Tax=Pedobacter rhizosphaerae TaxID=390241 RepID=A0A1H9TXI2_9SPHI|nr:hypothetical protein [Pedobacter rhizosphaerae]SES01708.1 hypothetical protein SAMN04488023_12532 [Pedobacter rhizosphaerae]